MAPPAPPDPPAPEGRGEAGPFWALGFSGETPPTGLVRDRTEQHSLPGGRRAGYHVPMTRELDALEDLLGHRFTDRLLLEEALRHGSASDDGRPSYQRLEFLGDAVLGHAMALLLYEAHPEADEGLLTRMKSLLTRSSSLAAKAAELGLETLVTVGPSEEMSGGRRRSALLEDLFEAVVGALALDAGWERTLEFVRRCFRDDLAELDESVLRLADAKSALQEAAQGRGLPLPEYRQVGAGGPSHRTVWAFEVLWDGEVAARGEGRTKRDAQQQAARRALARLGLVSK